MSNYPDMPLNQGIQPDLTPLGVRKVLVGCNAAKAHRGEQAGLQSIADEQAEGAWGQIAERWIQPFKGNLRRAAVVTTFQNEGKGCHATDRALTQSTPLDAGQPARSTESPVVRNV